MEHNSSLPREKNCREPDVRIWYGRYQPASGIHLGASFSRVSAVSLPLYLCLSPNLLLTPIQAIRWQCSRTKITIHGLGVCRPFYHLHRHQQHHLHEWVVIGSSASEQWWRTLS